MKFEGVDLNLLLVFDAIARERSVTKAARSLGLSQPAVSHALARLRMLLKDSLFVRSPEGMVATPRAIEMTGAIRQGIAQLRSAIETDVFEPATAAQSFSIAINNFTAVVIAPPLAARCAASAPNVRLVMRPSGTLDVESMLERGSLDLVIGKSTSDARNRDRLLMTDRHVAVMRRDHPLSGSPLTPNAFANALHLRITSIDEDDDFVDQELGKRDLCRSVALEAPYLSAGAILKASDLVAVAASLIADDLCMSRRLVKMDLPFDGPSVKIGMRWPRVYDGKASHKWLRECVWSSLH